MSQNQASLLQKFYQHGNPEELLAASTDVLAVFEFGRSPLSSEAPGHVPVALKPLDGECEKEVWRARGPVESGQWEEVRFARGHELTMGHIALDVDDCGGIQTASRIAYEQLAAFLERSPHHWPLKIWNYIPGINLGSGDDECYRQFCVGRAEALAAGYGEQPPMPAATAIGVEADEPALQVYFLAAALPGLHVENPRQVNAWQYPRQYGPRSPLFSRGTVVELNQQRQFLISGTASVIGHETHHADDVRRQVLESWRNVNSLVVEGYRLLGRDAPPDCQPTLLKIYVRDPADLNVISSTLEEVLSDDVPRIYLQGDICRSDLLTEMDGLACFDE